MREGGAQRVGYGYKLAERCAHYTVEPTGKRHRARKESPAAMVKPTSSGPQQARGKNMMLL